MIDILTWSPILIVLLVVLIAILIARITSIRASLQKRIIELEKENTQLSTKLATNQQLLEERGKLEDRFKDAFKTLSAEALSSQSVDFNNRYERLLKAGEAEITKATDSLDKEIKRLMKLEGDNAATFHQKMLDMTEESHRLGKRAQGLENALRKPNIRGGWAELHLKNALKAAEFREGTDFTTQDTFVVNEQEGETKKKRTDFIVYLPEGHSIILDSKTSLETLIDIGQTDDEEQKKRLLEKHLEQIKQHVKDLSKKEYWRTLENTPDYAVMVLQEPDFYYAVESDAGLTDWALSKKVIILTPPALKALLKALALTLKQVRVVEKAREIAKLGKDLHARLAVFVKHYLDVGESLKKTVGYYNKANKSWDTNLMSQVRKFQELEVSGDKNIEDTDDVEPPSTINKIPEPTTDD